MASGSVTIPTTAAPSTGVVRQVWLLAWPAILSFGLESLVALVDTLMVGRLGAGPLAGVGVGAQILHAVHVVVIAVSGGTVALVARFVGGGQRDEAERVLAQSLYTGAALGIAVGVPTFYFAASAVAAFGVEAEVVNEGAGFLRWLMLGLPFAATFQIFTAAFRGAGDMRTPLLLGATINVVNIACNYVFIFGGFGFPAMGARGSGLASTVAFAFGVVLAVFVMRRNSAVLRLRAAALRPDLSLVRRVLRIGLPAAIEQCFLQVGFFLYLAIASRYGTDAMAAYFIGVRILAMSFLPGLGFGAAASTIVGQNLGAGRIAEAARGGWDACRLAVGLMTVAGAAIFAGAEWIAAAFVNDAEVIAAAVPFIRTLAVAQPLMALDFTLSGALRGAGDTRFPLWVMMLGFYVARLGFAWTAAAVFDLGLTWVWLALLGDYAVRASLKVARFRGERWHRVAV